METSARKRFFARLLCAGVSQKELLRMLSPQDFFNMQDTLFDAAPSSMEPLFDPDTSALAYFCDQNPRKYAEISGFFGSAQDTRVCEILDQDDISIVLAGDREYPAGLYEITNSPSVLFVRGKLCENPLLAIVGPRKPSSYGEGIVRKFTPDLIRAGFGIVSGGAYGIDSLAHEITLANGGYTVAVIGTGIDVSYPLSHRKLYDRIVDSGGAVVSVFPIGMPALAYNFPIRNEIVVGFSCWVFAPEAGERSGTLITTALALDANREVFTVPGDIYRASSLGTNKLIRNSLAKPCLSSEDILEEYGILKLSEKSIHKAKTPENPVEKAILSALENEDSLSFEGILEYTSLDSSEALGALSLLEISGIIARTHGKYHKK